jgi:outer membrane receptor protein involved in Fe transport
MPAFTRRYHGLELSLDRRFAERWSASASYSWSRLRGTSDGLASADVAGQVLLPNAGDNCEFLEGCFTDAGRVDDGPLSLDRPHQWKLYGAYRSPFGLTAGAFFQFVSGTPYEPFADVNTAPGVRVRFVHIGGRASSGRSDPLMQTNLYLEHALKLGRARHLALFANVINLFDQHEGTDLFQALYLGAISVPRQVFFQGFDHAATAAAQRQGRDPRFGQPVRFQDPRRVRIGVRLAF